MNSLFSPNNIGYLRLPNRLVRSATAEALADVDGRPRPALMELYRRLARGGVGLIISGHMFVHPSGKAHAEMTGIHSDDLLPDLAMLAKVVHQEGGRISVQLNHGGMQCEDGCVADPIAPSAINAPFLQQPAREMTTEEIEMLIEAYAQAARRAKEAGFDGVQLHAAHGYLINQFLSPYTNHRNDHWGGNLEKRLNFLRAVCQAVRQKVGANYPLFIKLGMIDDVPGGMAAEEGKAIVATLAEMGLDAIEISGGIEGRRSFSIRKGIRSTDKEAYFLHLARQARTVTSLPIILVGGFRSRQVMEKVLADGDADFIALCRPLICQPDLPQRMRLGLQDRSECLSANNCWPKAPGEGITCKCPRGLEVR